MEGGYGRGDVLVGGGEDELVGGCWQTGMINHAGHLCSHDGFEGAAD